MSSIDNIVRGVSDVADWLWERCAGWDKRAEYIASQLCRAIDSVGANLMEGYGREYAGSLRQFYGYARGSGLEAAYWLDRAIARRLLPAEEGSLMLAALRSSLGEVDTLINALPRGKGNT